MTSPIGSLLVDAEAKARKKKSQEHTSEAPCGCRVMAAWFSANSRRTRIEACSDHTIRRDA